MVVAVVGVVLVVEVGVEVIIIVGLGMLGVMLGVLFVLVVAGVGVVMIFHMKG